MPNVDPEAKSQKTLKTEELEVLIRLLNSNLESLRYLQRESSIRDDVALNNRLLTARISALSGLITFMSEGELTQIRASSVSMHDTANSTTRPRETTNPPTNPLGRTVRNLSLPVDDDEEGQADDESEYDDDDDDDNYESDEEAEGEEGEETAYPQSKETHSNIPSRPRPPIFQSIRPLMEVLRTGIQDIPPTTLHTNFKVSKPPLIHRPRNNHTNCSVTTTTTTTKWRSEYEMGDISSIDGKRRPVAGIPAPIRWVPRGRGVLKGGEEPRRGNLIDLKKTRRPRFLPQISRTRMAVTPTADVPVPSSVNDVRFIPRKRPLHDDDLEEELVDKKRQRVSRSSSDLSMEPGPPRPTIPPRETASNWKAMRTKLSVEENNNRNTALHSFSATSCSSSSDDDIAPSTTSTSACLVPGSPSSDALILNRALLPTPTQIHEEPEKEMSNSSLPLTSPPSLDMPSSASDSAIIPTTQAKPDMGETSCILS